MSQSEIKPAKEMEIHELEEFLKTKGFNTEFPGAKENFKNFAKDFAEKDLGNEKKCEKVSFLEEKFMFLEEQCSFARSETKRVSAQYEIDKENWSLQFEHMKRQLQKGGKSEGLKPEKKENYQNKLIFKEMKEKIESLNSEIFGVKKNYEALKSQSNKKILALEAELEKLKKKEAQQRQTIEEKNKIIENLRNSSKNPERTTKNPRKNLSTHKNPLKNSRSNSFSETPTLETQTVQESYNTEPESLIKEIGKIEKQLMDLGTRYKLLLESSSSSDNLSGIRKEIGEITEKMEEKNDLLYSLKKKHQDYLRSHIKTLETSKNY